VVLTAHEDGIAEHVEQGDVRSVEIPGVALGGGEFGKPCVAEQTKECPHEVLAFGSRVGRDRSGTHVEAAAVVRVGRPAD